MRGSSEVVVGMTPGMLTTLVRESPGKSKVDGGNIFHNIEKP